MFTFRGNITGSVYSLALNLPTLIESFSVVNKSAATVGVNVYLLTNGRNVSIAPLNLQLATSEMYEGTRQIVVLATEQIHVRSSGSVDYDFTISNLKIPSVEP